MGTTAQKLIYLNDTKSKIKDSINSLGGNITSQTTFRQYVTELDSIYSNLPKVSGTGSILSLSPTLKGRIKSTLKGNTFQQTYTGKNLLPYENTTQTLYGVTITHNQDGSITINGTSTQGFSYQLFNENKKILDITKDYVLSTQIEMPDKSFLRLQNANNSNVFVDVKSETGTVTQKKYIKFNGSAINNENVKCFLYLYGNYTFNNYTIYPMLEEGTTMTSFEPYVGGTASPNPNYPQDIRLVTGDNEVVVSNKNLLYLDDVTETIVPQALVNMKIVNGIMYLNGTATGTIGHENGFWKNNVSIVIKAGTYYYKNFENMSIVIRNAITNNLITTTDTNGSFTLSQDTQCFFGVRISSGTSFANQPVQYYLGKSNETEYITPLQQKVTLHLGTNYLAGIGDYRDEIVGKKDDWKIKRYVGKAVLNGSEDWHYNSTYGVFYMTSLSNYSRIAFIPYSNYFKGVTSVSSVSAMSINNTLAFNTADTDRLFIKNEDFSNVTDFKSWLSTNNVTLYYQLATPTEETITNQTLITDLNNMYNLMGYDGQTNITITSNSANAQMTAQVKALKGE